MMKVPTNVPCQNVLMPSRIRLLRMTSISAAPTTAPKAVPTPPDQVGASDHGAAITDNSMPCPRLVVIVPSQPTSRMPAMPAHRLQNM